MNIKTYFLVLLFSIAGYLAHAQLVGKAVCPPLTADVMAGSVNELVPKSAIVENTAKLPCSNPRG